MKKVVLAYSGGLDTSVILKWIKETYQCEVATFTADLGQDENFDAVKKKAEAQNVTEIFIEDLKDEFVKDYVFPMLRANPLYEGYYLLGTSIARPLIAKKQIEIAKQVNADAVAHGATGKGNDQIRFELGYYYHNPNIKVISPWREWDLNSRSSLVEYADKNGIEIAKDKGIEVIERAVDKTELFIADEVFLSGTAAKITPIKSIESTEMQPNMPMMKELRNTLTNITEGKNKTTILDNYFKTGNYNIEEKTKVQDNVKQYFSNVDETLLDINNYILQTDICL